MNESHLSAAGGNEKFVDRKLQIDNGLKMKGELLQS